MSKLHHVSYLAWVKNLDADISRLQANGVDVANFAVSAEPHGGSFQFLRPLALQ